MLYSYFQKDSELLLSVNSLLFWNNQQNINDKRINNYLSLFQYSVRLFSEVQSDFTSHTINIQKSSLSPHLQKKRTLVYFFIICCDILYKVFSAFLHCVKRSLTEHPNRKELHMLLLFTKFVKKINGRFRKLSIKLQFPSV